MAGMGIRDALLADKDGLADALRGWRYFQDGGKGYRLGDLPVVFSDVAMAYVRGE